jgi:hypothetical protein
MTTELSNRVVKINQHKKPIWDRVARSALINCDDDEWLQVIIEAETMGVLSPNGQFMRDVIEFNKMASKFPGTVRAFLNQLPRRYL